MPVHSTSTLMPNHVAGQPLPAQRELAVAYTTDQAPILFALDDNQRLTVTLPSDTSATGWAQVDLSAQLAGQAGLGASPCVQCFAASQDATGAIWLVLAAADSPDGDSTILLSRQLSNGASPAAWYNFASGIVPRAVPAGNTFTELVLGSADDGLGAPHIVGGALSGAMMQHYQINPDPNDTTWTCLPLVLPQNATACLAATAGSAPGLGRGVYSLCQLETLVSLTFTTLPVIFGGHTVTQSRQLALPAGFTATTTMAIAAMSTGSGDTELYLSGNGLYRYPLSAQQQSNQPAQLVAGPELFTSTAQLVVSGDPAAQGVDVWALNGADLLVHVAGTLSGQDYAWRPPAYLATEVTALAGYRAPAVNGAVAIAAALGKSDGSLALMTKDTTTDLWAPQTVSLDVPDTALQLNTYTTRITVTDLTGVAVSSQTVHLSADADVPALVNGQYYLLKRAVAKPVTTDPSGVITIVLETGDLTAPVYTVSVAEVSTHADAGADVKTALRGITEGSQIANAQRSDGQPLFPNGANGSACAAAAEGVQELMKVQDDLAGNPHRVQAARALAATAPQRLAGLATAAPGRAARSAFGVRFTPDGAVTLRGKEALAAQAELGDAIFLDPGDLIGALWSGAQQAGQWFLNAVDDGWQFLVDLGGQLVSFVFELAAQAVAAINWVLQNTLGLSLEDLIAWLGYMFNWDDILRNHMVLVHIANLGLDYAVAQVGAMKVSLHDAANTVRSALINDRLVVDQSNALFADRARSGPPDSADPGNSAQASWGQQQMASNGASATVAPVAIGDLDNILSGLTEAEAQVFQNAAGLFQTQLVDNFDDLSWGEILTEFLNIVGAAIIDTIENVAMTVLEAVTALVAIFKQMVNARWDIPVLTYVYEQIICGGDGSKLTLMDLGCLLIAIPATIACKALTPDHRDMFSDESAAAVLRASSWDELLTALVTKPTRPASRALAAGEPDDARGEMIAAAGILWGAGVARSAACFFYWQRETSQLMFAKDKYNQAKLIFDWLTWIFGMVNLGLVTAASQDTTSGRYVIDATITSSQLLVRMKDTYLVAYKLKNGKESDSKPVLCYCEVAFGIAILIGACVSIGLQASEPPPPRTSQEVWNTQMAFKFIQNCMTGLYRTLAFVPVSADPRVKKFGPYARGAMLIVRALASDTLAVVGAVHTVSDVY
jgi:hypothetical protein